MAKKLIRLTPDELRRVTTMHLDPGIRAMIDAYVSYAKRAGGSTLAYWRLAQGPWFGQSVVMTDEAIADHLDLPLSEVTKIAEDSLAAVTAMLKRDADFQALKCRLEQRRGEE